MQKSYLNALIGSASQPCVELSDKDDKKSCHDDRGLPGVLCWHECCGAMDCWAFCRLFLALGIETNWFQSWNDFADG